MELEEEKKAQAEREKRLQEQAKKIENLSSMVLCSNRDDNRNPHKKVFTRITLYFFSSRSFNCLLNLDSISARHMLHIIPVSI